MRTTIQNLLSALLAPMRQSRCRTIILASVFAFIVFVVQCANAFPIITSVVETGGENDANDTVVAKWTGVTWIDHAAGEPILGLATGQPYTVGLFGSHAPAMVDRAHRYTNATPTVAIPPYLIGGEYIMSGNDNRGRTPYTLDVTVSSAVRVYLLIDNRLGDTVGTTPPVLDATHMQWVVDEGWTPVKTGLNQVSDINLPDEVGIDESADGTINQQFSVYTKDFPAGTFQLKQADNAGQNMYGAVVTAAPQPLPKFVNVGGNAIGTSTFDQGSGTLTIVGGGNDIWDMGDEFSYAYDNKVGDFDMRVRVESLSPNARWSKAGIMVRESLAEDSRMIYLRVAPPDVPTSNGGNGANDIKLGYRTGNFSSMTDGDPGENDGRHEDPGDQNPPPYPNAWLRLVRSGNLFSAHISSDGSTWTQITSQDTGTGNWTTGGGAFNKDVVVGLAVSRHSGGASATAVFHDISFQDGTAFGMSYASSRGNPNAILVGFNKAPDAASLAPVSFDIVGVTILSISPGPYANSYWLNVDPTTPLVEGTTYTVTAFSVTSGGGTESPSPDTDTFVHGAGYEASGVHVGHNKFRSGNGPSVRNDTTAGQRGLFSVADGSPALVSNSLFEDVIADNGSNERYATRIFGVLNITTAGSHVFAMSSDDVGELYLGSSDAPASRVSIAREPSWNGGRQYVNGGNQATRGNPPSNFSTPQNLAVGQYYLELVYGEGGGGNNGSAAWQPPGAPAIGATSEPIPASAFALSRYFNGSERGELFRNLGAVSIVRQPASLTVIGGNPVTFSVGADGTPAYRYQWRKNGLPIPGANGPTYTIAAAVLADEGMYSATVANEFSSAASATAQLTVNIPTPPVALSATPNTTFASLLVKFDKRVQTSSAQNTANYTISGGVTVNSATVDATGTAVVLTTSQQAEGATYTLTVKDVKEITGNNALTPNPTALTFQTLVFSPGFALKEYYQTWTAGGGSVDAFAAAVQAGTTSPTISCYVNLWQQNTADEYDNYGGRISGFFVPTADGPHVFYFASDDFGRLFLSTDENPANKVEIAREPVWSGRRTWVGEAGGSGRLGVPSASGGAQANISGPINLLAGHRYYLEGVFTEGGGGDNMAVAVQGPGQPEPVNDSSPITAANIGTYASPVGASAAITQHPVDATRAEGTFATFTAAGAASSTACGSVSTFQWFRNGVPIIGASSPTLNYGPVTPADNGAMFKVRVAAVGAYADSAEARLTVVAPEPLKVVRAEGVCNLRQVRIVFDQFVDPTTSQDVFNYTSDSFGISTAVRNPDNLSVTLTLDDASASQTPGASYCVHVKGVVSASNQAMVPDEVNACFQACVVSCGFAQQEIYRDIGGGVSISDLIAAPSYPNSPTTTRYVGGLSANTGDEFDNYGTRISGYIIPPVSGGYVFYLASDDGGDFALSTDSSPANLVPLAVEPVWASRRRFVGGDGDGTAANRTGTASPSGGPQANISGTINLVAGQQYYFEARMKEGGGGDNLDVAWKVPGGAEPTVGSAPISGAFLASLASPAGASVTITAQPANQCAEVNTAATFTVGINATTGGAPTTSAFYQWYRMIPGGDWLPIDGATSATYAPIVNLADNGNKYRVAIYVPGANATSAEATLSVYRLNTAPQFTGGADQTSACGGSASVANWATGIQPHSINRTPIQISYDFSTVPAGSTMINRVLDVNTNGTLIRDGILKLTDAINGSQGGFLTAALPTVIESFTVTFKLRMGGGTCCGAALPDGSGVTRPADGMSITIGDVQVPLSFPVAAEEGAAVGGGGGVVVAFDTWDNNGTDEAPAVDVKVGGTVIGFQSLDGGEREGGRPPAGPFITDPATGQPLTFQTGAQFADVRIHLDADGTLDVDFKGVRVIDNLQTGLGDLVNARIAFGGRTGGANNNQWVDDLQITALPLDASSSEASQTVQFVVTTDNPGLFASGPAISPNGTLSYTLAAGACGSANVTAVLKDDGGTATCGTAVGQDTSAAYTFKISTAADTVPPTITCPINITVDATSAAGALVSYPAPIATDNCSASVVCAPASGSTFAIGTTPVTCTATDCAGLTASCTFSVTVRDVQTNRPPVAVISSEQLIDLKPEYDVPVLLSCNWWNACLVADGWSSTDPEGGNLTYLWSLGGDPVPFGAGPVVTNCLEVGQHTIILTVTDPEGLSGTDTKTIEIVTAPLAIEILIEQINESHKSGVVLSRKIKRELTETLRVALGHAGREELRATQKALDAFEKKVRAQVAPTEPEAATAWIRWSQAVSDGMEKCIKPPRKGKDHDDTKKDDGSDSKKR